MNNDRFHHHRSKQRGSAILLALGFMVIAMVLALGTHVLVAGQLRASGALRERVAAEYLAQGGIARTIAWINSQGYRMPQASTLTATVPVRLISNNAAVVLPSNHPNGYTDALGQPKAGVVTNYNSFLTSQSAGGGTYGVVASLISIQPETWELLATGQLGGTHRQVGAIVYRQQDSLFGDGLFGRDSVTLGGDPYTDSYDSSAGAYGVANKANGGNVHSNGNVALNGNATVNGNAVPGPNMTTTLIGNAVVTGQTTPAQTAKVLMPVTIPAGARNIATIQLSGNSTQTLTAGTYVLDSLSITGNGQLIIDSTAGPVNLYVTGSISIAGNGVSNASGKPANLMIWETGNADISFTGNTAFFGTLYAPNSALSLAGNGDLYGAFVGASIDMHGTAGIHYDQTLRAIPGAPGPVTLISQWTLQS